MWSVTAALRGRDPALLPEGVPVIVTGTPAAGVGNAVPSAVSVNTLAVAETGFGKNDAVTPAGRPEAERLTSPVEPKNRPTDTLSVACVPTLMSSDPWAAATSKSGGTTAR